MQQIVHNIQGLKTNPSPLTTQPGNLSVAKNINIDSPDTATSRRGFGKYGNEVTLDTDEKIKKIFDYASTLIVHYESTLARDSSSTGVWQAYTGTYKEPDADIGLPTIKNRGNLYFGTTNGVKKLDSISGTPADAGVPKALDIEASLTGASGFFETDSQLAYRVVWGIRDSNNIVSLGTPSGREEIANDTSLTADVSLTITIPTGITTAYFYQVYRSGFSANDETIANDELFLVYEDNPTSAEIAAKSLTITDNTPDALKGAALYTNPSQETISQSNDRPPFCKDMCLYKQSVLYANTKTRHRLQLTLLGVGEPNGVEVGDVITIDGVDFTGGVAEGADVFKVVEDGTPAENIADTARSLVRVINKSSSFTKTLNAFYLSGYNQLPGQLLLERQAVNSEEDPFYVTFTTDGSIPHGNAWNPTLPAAGSTDVSSANEVKTNRIYVSKQGQPEAVPILNYFDVGNTSASILRIVPLTTGVFVFMNDNTIHRVVGENISNFIIDLFDSTAQLKGPKTAQVFNNEIWFFSDQGVVSVSDSGVAVKSWAIEDTLRPYLSPTEFPNTDNEFFGVSYESDRRYLLSNGDGTFWGYNTFTDSWTSWTLNANNAYINPVDDKMYLVYSDGYVYKERKDRTIFDYADDPVTTYIESQDNLELTIDSGTQANVGDTIKQGTKYSRITAVSGDVITVEDFFNWTTGSAGEAEIFTPIACQLTPLPCYGDNPMIMKHFREMVLNFRDINGSINNTFKNNFNTIDEDTSTMTINPYNTGWGQAKWGNEEWGGGTISGSQELRTYIPTDKQRCLGLIPTIKVERAFTKFTLNGITLYYDTMSERFRKDD